MTGGSLRNGTLLMTMANMSRGTMKAKKTEDKKRQREEEESQESSSPSGSEEEPEQRHEEKESSESESETDSSDEETENALFRPAAARNRIEDEESSSESEETEVEVDLPAKNTAKKASPLGTGKETKTTETNSLSKELEDEVARKTEATVYIEGIPYKANESDIVTHFAPCGIVKEVRMPRYQDSRKPRGYAHVVFESASAIPKALKLDGKYLFGRYLTVKLAERPRTLETAIKEQHSVKKAVKGCKTVFVKHLPYDVEEAAVKEALASCGTIISVRLPLWNHTKKLKGFGYVEFSKEEEAIAAVKRSGMRIGDRMVIISLETVASAPKASFRTTDGRFWRKGEEAKSSLAAKLTEKHKKPAKPDHKSKKLKTK